MGKDKQAPTIESGPSDVPSADKQGEGFRIAFEGNTEWESARQTLVATAERGSLAPHELRNLIGNMALAMDIQAASAKDKLMARLILTIAELTTTEQSGSENDQAPQPTGEPPATTSTESGESGKDSKSGEKP